MHKEFERKFLVNEFPIVAESSQLLSSHVLEEVYLSTSPIIVRARRKITQSDRGHAQVSEYKLCFKKGEGIERFEYEKYLDATDFAYLSSIVEKPPIKKLYRKYLLPNNLILEVSVVDAETSHSFMYAEIEFKSKEEAEAFDRSQCAYLYYAREVTNDPFWRMYAYWERTRLGTTSIDS